MKQTIKLTESQFKKVITETIKKVLRESDNNQEREPKFSIGDNVYDKHLNDNVIYTVETIEPFRTEPKYKGSDGTVYNSDIQPRLITYVYLIGTAKATNAKEYNWRRAFEEDLIPAQ